MAKGWFSMHSKIMMVLPCHSNIAASTDVLVSDATLLVK
jgi:hypothetical protein